MAVIVSSVLAASSSAQADAPEDEVSHGHHHADKQRIQQALHHGTEDAP
jgi:hypothetical protein